MGAACPGACHQSRSKKSVGLALGKKFAVDGGAYSGFHSVKHFLVRSEEEKGIVPRFFVLEIDEYGVFIVSAGGIISRLGHIQFVEGFITAASHFLDRFQVNVDQVLSFALGADLVKRDFAVEIGIFIFHHHNPPAKEYSEEETHHKQHGTEHFTGVVYRRYCQQLIGNQKTSQKTAATLAIWTASAFFLMRHSHTISLIIKTYNSNTNFFCLLLLLVL